MENIGGGLGFAATLDIDDFNVSAEAMDRHFRQISTNIQLEAEDMEQSLLDFAQKGAMYIQAYLVGQGMTGLLNSIVQVRGQFQQLEIAFTTMLGSEQKASQLMNQMIQTAAKTPFDLAGIAGGAKQLLAYGESAERVNDTLVRLVTLHQGFPSHSTILFTCTVLLWYRDAYTPRMSGSSQAGAFPWLRSWLRCTV